MTLVAPIGNPTDNHPAPHDPTTHAPTAAALLYGAEDPVTALADSLKRNQVMHAASAALGALSAVALDAVGRQVATVVHDLLDVDLAPLLSAGWRKLTDLGDAARRTLETGGSEIVELASHTVTSTHEPHVELRIDTVPVASVEFELTVTFTLKAVVATIRQGRLVELLSGTCELEAILLAEKRQLAQRTAHWDLPLVLHLGDGIALLDPGPPGS